MTDLITPTEAWLKAVDPYTCPDPNDHMREDLLKATDDLLATLEPISILEHSESFHIERAIIGLTAQFIFGHYTDSDTDAPCDIEWDLHHLHAVLNPGYVIPDEVQLAYVIGTAFPAPDEEE